MAIAKRIFLFLLVNILVVLTISLILQVLGVTRYTSYYGIDYSQLAIFCLVWGMTGSFISLALSRVMAKWMMGVKIIDPHTHDSHLQDLVQKVHSLARSAGLPAMPQVGIYESPDINAFATGPTKSRALVAVSTGLMQRMSDEEVEGVLGHEIAHVANGDMVTMTLLQGIVNAFVMFLSRVLAFAISQALRSKDEEGRSSSGFGMQYMIQFFLEIVLMILGSMITAWFSRYREFRADAGGARLAGRHQMVNALKGLQRAYGMMEEVEAQHPAPASMKAFRISGPRGGFMALFSTHPPLEERIARLESAIG